MAATTDQVYQLLGTVNRKLDTLLMEAGIIMSQGDDLAAELTADTALLQGEIATLNASFTRLSGLVDQLEAGQGQPVPPEIITGFRTALGGLKPAVDKIATIGQPVTPPPPPPPPPPGT